MLAARTISRRFPHGFPEVDAGETSVVDWSKLYSSAAAERLFLSGRFWVFDATLGLIAL